MKKIKLKTSFLLVSSVLWLALAQPAAAQVEIPEGAVIDSAVLSVCVRSVEKANTVTVHEVLGTWTETEVTWNNRPAFDSFPEASLDITNSHCYSTDTDNIRNRVQQWVDDPDSNHGFLLKASDPTSGKTNYFSSEYITDPSKRPKLEISYYTTDPTDVTNIVIQRPGDETDGVTDAYIWELYPNQNRGTAELLYTGLVRDYEKQSLIRFDFTVVPPPSGGGEGCTPGYWKQRHHFDSWTDYEEDELFSEVFDVDAFGDMTLLEVLKQGGGKLKALGRHAVAALLNAASSGVSYDLSEDEIIEMFNDAYNGNKNDIEAIKDEFEAFNESGCPLN